MASSAIRGVSNFGGSISRLGADPAKAFGPFARRTTYRKPVSTPGDGSWLSAIALQPRLSNSFPCMFAARR